VTLGAVLKLLPGVTALIPLGLWSVIVMLRAYLQHLQDTSSSAPDEKDSSQTKHIDLVIYKKFMGWPLSYFVVNNLILRLQQTTVLQHKKQTQRFHYKENYNLAFYTETGNILITLKQVVKQHFKNILFNSSDKRKEKYFKLFLFYHSRVFKIKCEIMVNYMFLD